MDSLKSATDRANEVGRLIREAGMKAEAERAGKVYRSPQAQETPLEALQRLSGQVWKPCVLSPSLRASLRLPEPMDYSDQEQRA